MKMPKEATLTYWFFIIMAALSVLMSFDSTDRERLYQLFGATFLIIHAHGHRIRAAVEEGHSKQATND